ncbi:MAG: hypothetical protein J2P24_16485 [Streptosporangiales bacterium]|nr:hypothetical protein [Streptosporangiales bacterium]MBO0889506.1 hypothetical protein [Acidothermales bacterium]
MTGWRTRPPSQYVQTKGKRGGSLWLTVIVGIICLALGAAAGLTVRGNGNTVGPDDPKAAAKRDQLTASADAELAALAQLDGAIGVPGEPTSYGVSVLGKERRDTCATGDKGFTKHGWYSSACGVKVTWYLAAQHGSVASIEAAIRARFKARRIPDADAFTWTEHSGPLPSRLSGQFTATTNVSARGLHALQEGTAIHFPEQKSRYRDETTTVDLPTAYAGHRTRSPVVARISLLAQYAWAK